MDINFEAIGLVAAILVLIREYMRASYLQGYEDLDFDWDQGLGDNLNAIFATHGSYVIALFLITIFIRFTDPIRFFDQNFSIAHLIGYIIVTIIIEIVSMKYVNKGEDQANADKEELIKQSAS